jgi:hypothetical protein
MNTLIEREDMKFIIKGRTFDTSTSQTVAVASGVYQPEQFDEWFPAQSVRYEDVLYRTAKGSLFVHSHETAKYDKGKPVVKDNATELTPEKAVEWIEEIGARVLDPDGLPLPDEA